MSYRTANVSNTKWSPNSIVYVLSFWSKIAASFTTQKLDKFRPIEKALTEICLRFIDSRIQGADNEGILQLGSASLHVVDFDNEDLLLINIENVASIARSSYPACAQKLCQIYSGIAGNYASNMSANGDGRRTIESVAYSGA